MMNYKEIRTLGKGSFGRAVLVKEISTGQDYVMKIINTCQMKPKERQDALQEAQLLKHLNSPYITKYHASFTDANNLYIVMEYCNAGDLHSLIKEYKSKAKYISEDDIWHLVVQLLLGLKHLHDRKLLHRDIKSQNTLLNATDPEVLKNPYQHISSLTVKLADLGCSKILQATNQLAATQVASPYYMSPEIATNTPYSSKSDIWSLGVTIYELCTLQHAFEANSLKALVYRILQGTYKPIPSIYSQDLQQLIKLCLQKDQKLRPNINQLVNLPAVQKHMRQIIPRDVLQDELSHTMLHQGNLLQGFEYDKRAKDHQAGIKNDENSNGNVFTAPGTETLAKKFNELEAYAQQVGINKSQIQQQSQQQPQQQKIQYQPRMQPQVQQQVQQKPQQINVNAAYQQQQQGYQNLQPLVRPVAQNRLNGQGPAKLAPMNEKEKIRWLKEKEQQERRQRIINSQKEHQKKMEELQRAKQQKQIEIDKKYEEQMAKRRRESLEAEKRQAQIQQQIQQQKQVQQEQLKKDKMAAELDLQQKQILYKEKAEKERQQLQKLIEQRKQQLKNKPMSDEIEILENPNQKAKIQYEAKTSSEKIQQTLEPLKKSVQSQQSQPQDDKNTEGSDFADEPQAAIANINHLADDKASLLNDNTKSLPYRIEALHYNLEKELTFDTFFKTYKLVEKRLDEDEDVSADQLKTVLKEDQLGYVNAIVQLLLAEQRVNEQNI